MSAIFDATTFFATYLAAYAADLSTLLGSFPEKAPPPCGAAPHGGGAFSGKDPSKVDRSAAYAARYVAKNVVASKIADKCLIQLAYAIGVSKPLSIYVDLFDGDEEKSKHVEKLINDNFDLSPRGIREMLDLNKPIYECTAAYGHFGRKPGTNGSFSWEKTDKIDIFKK